MDENVRTMIFPDGKEYFILDKVSMDEKVYFILAEVLNEDEIVIRKVINDNKEFYLSQLDSDEEFDKVMGIFAKQCDSLIKE